jgi:hypothetical protein
MPVGLVRKWLLVGTLAAAVGATACKDDDTDEPADSGGGGGNDSGAQDSGGGGSDSGGGGNDAGHDAGMDSGAASIMCGELTCTGHTIKLSGQMLAPGCTKSALDADVCGISTVVLGPADAGLPPYLEKGAPGVLSTACTTVIDGLEPLKDGGADASTRGNDSIEVTTNNLTISYPGCCNAAGFCSGQTDQGKLVGMDVVGGFGCMNPAVFLTPFEPDVSKRFIPCDAVSGDLKPAGDGGASDGGADAGVDAGHDSGASDAGDGGNS